MNNGEKGHRLIAYHLAEDLDVKKLKNEYQGELVFFSSNELFYSLPGERYMMLLDYGVAVFCNFDEGGILAMLNSIDESYSSKSFPERKREDYCLEVSGEPQVKAEYDSLKVPVVNSRVMQIAMLHLAQTVALDSYLEEARNLLGELKEFNVHLERTGRTKIGKKSMMSFIGRGLNIKHRIIEDLYIFDVPQIVWEDEYLDNIHTSLTKYYEYGRRMKEMDYTVQIIDDSLNIYKELFLHRESSILEWIIIILILIEVVDLFV